MYAIGDIVKYSPKFCSPGEEFYIHIVTEADRGQYLISTLNTLLSLGSTERVDEEMIKKADRYEIIYDKNAWNRKYIITDTYTRKFFAGRDPAGNATWTASDSDASGMDIDKAKATLVCLTTTK